MSRFIYQLIALAIISVFASVAPSTNAEAGRYKAKCNGQYQLVQGNWISTPLCEERVLAKVARSYGHSKVRAKHYRKYSGSKIGTCLAYGHDIRLSGICGAYRPRGRF